MLKVFETTQTRLVIKEERSTYDARMLAIFNYSATYLLLFFSLYLWSQLGFKNIFLEYIYNTITHPPFSYFYVIALCLGFFTLHPMLSFGSYFPIRTFTFDRERNLLTISSKYFFWHRKIEYHLGEIQSLQWFTELVYTGGMTVVNVQFLKLIRRKRNDKTHLIPLRHTLHSETSTTVALINKFLSNLR